MADPYKFEDNFGYAVFAELTARAMPHGNVRANVELTPDRVDFTAHHFAQASPQMALSASGAWFHNHYAFALDFDVRTQRGGANAANHNVWVANVRTLMARQTQFFTANNLPAYTILRLDEVAGDPDEDAPTDTDVSRLSYRGELSIVGSQMP